MVVTSFISKGQKQQNRKPTVLSINEAIEKGIVELRITGASDPRIFHELIDRDGIHFGKCMTIILKSNIDSLVLLRIDCGTELIPFDTIFQTMIVTKTVELPIYPEQTYATRIYAMCGQIHDDPPYIETAYVVGKLADSSTVKLAQYFEKNFIQNMIGQHALWAYTDEANFKELEIYGADSLSIYKTKEILNSLALETKLTEELAISKGTETDLISINRYYLFVGAGLLLILTTISITLVFRSKKKDETIT